METLRFLHFEMLKTSVIVWKLLDFCFVNVRYFSDLKLRNGHYQDLISPGLVNHSQDHESSLTRHD